MPRARNAPFCSGNPGNASGGGSSAAVRLEHPDVNAQVKRTWASREIGNIMFKLVLGLCPSCSPCRVKNREKNLTLAAISVLFSLLFPLSRFDVAGLDITSLSICA